MKSELILASFPWKHYHGESIPRLKAIQAKTLELFDAYSPQPGDITGTWGYPKLVMDVAHEDERFFKLLKELELFATESKCCVVFRQFPTPQEAARARFIKVNLYGNYVQNDQSDMYACGACRTPNLESVPKPFLVNKTVLKSYDVFHTEVGLMVVRPRVLAMLKKLVGDQFTFGEATIANSKIRAKGDDRLFWIRPKEVTGQQIRITEGKATCPECKRTKLKRVYSTDNMVNASGPGLLDERLRVAHFGSGKAELAWIDNLPYGGWPEFAMSSALIAHLVASGVKGFVSAKTYPADCVFSEKGEPALDPTQRTFGKLVGKSAKANRDKALAAKARQVTASLKELPWDCSKDGCVYFYLTTPQFVVMDPMTGEEDDEGPYSVKSFEGPGVYKLPVRVIKQGSERGVAVDSATLLFVDNAFLAEFIECYAWEKAMDKRGNFDLAYHQQVAEQVGTRFGICSPPPSRFKSDFIGDGFYSVHLAGTPG